MGSKKNTRSARPNKQAALNPRGLVDDLDAPQPYSVVVSLIMIRGCNRELEMSS